MAERDGGEKGGSGRDKESGILRRRREGKSVAGLLQEECKMAL